MLNPVCTSDCIQSVVSNLSRTLPASLHRSRIVRMLLCEVVEGESTPQGVADPRTAD